MHYEEQRQYSKYKHYNTLKEARQAKTLRQYTWNDLPPILIKIVRFIAIYFFITTPFIVLEDPCLVFRETDYTHVNRMLNWLSENVLFFDSFFVLSRYLFFTAVDYSNICQWYKR